MQARLLLSPTERSRFIRNTLKHLCREPRFRHQWRPADHLATLCHNWFTIPEPLQFNGNDLNNALLKDPALKLDIDAEKSAPNQFGIYHNTYRPSDANRKIHFYYLCDPDGNGCVKSPPLGMAWYDTVPQLIDKIQALECATRNKERRELPADVIDLVSKAKALVQERDKLENERATKRRRLVDGNDSCDSSKSELMGIDGCDSCHGNNGDEATSGPMPPQLAPGYNIWWDSMDADRLFNVNKERERLQLTDYG